MWKDRACFCSETGELSTGHHIALVTVSQLLWQIVSFGVDTDTWGIYPPLSSPRGKPCAVSPAWSLCLQLSPPCHQLPGLGELGTGSVSSGAPTAVDSLRPHIHLHLLMHLQLSLPAAWWGLSPGKDMVLSELLQATQTGRTHTEF